MYEADDNPPPALVYCRVSSKRQAEAASLAAQRDACAALAARLGYRIARVTEEVYTGALLFGRPQLTRDRADIRAGKVKALIAYSVDRLTRDKTHLAILSGECERAGCRLIFVAADDPAGGLSSWRDEAYAAGVERRQIAGRKVRGHRAKLAQGRPTFNGCDLFGYRPDRERGVYVIYEPEAEVVRRVFAMCAGGKGTHTIASALNREGVPSPKPGTRPGAKWWRSSTVCQMLHAPSYKGEEYRCRYDDTRHKRRPESEWVRLPDGVRPVIVSPELWEECQRLIRARAAKLNNKVRRTALLRGHIFCAACGARMFRTKSKRANYVYEDKYRCATRWRPYPTECDGEVVSVGLVEEWVVGKIGEYLLRPGAAERAVGKVELAASPLRADIEAVSWRRQQVEKNFLTLTSSLRSPALSPDLLPHLAREAEQISREKRELEEASAELETRLAEFDRSASDFRRLASELARGGKSLTALPLEERRLALAVLGVKVHANGDDPTRWRYESDVPITNGLSPRAGLQSLP